MSKKKCLFCSNDKKHVAKLVRVITAIMRKRDAEQFLTDFILGDLSDQPIEVIRLMRRLKLTDFNPQQEQV